MCAVSIPRLRCRGPIEASGLPWLSNIFRRFHGSDAVAPLKLPRGLHEMPSLADSTAQMPWPH